MMRVREILRRLNGFSTPLGGLSWEPPGDSDMKVAQHVLDYLADRRVLFNPYEAEVPEHCLDSVQNIRTELTQELRHAAPNGRLAAILKAMRAECRRLLDEEYVTDWEAQQKEVTRKFGSQGHVARTKHFPIVFYQHLGEFRAVMGVRIAELAAHHGLDVEEPLASIIPADPEQG
jgi:hypothetical protein